MSNQKRSLQTRHSTRNDNNDNNDGNPPEEDTFAVAASKSGPKQKVLHQPAQLLQALATASGDHCDKPQQQKVPE
eukprot:10573876-Ditylum_brightwellii.AAC.1